jgi:hypothetical protein
MPWPSAVDPHHVYPHHDSLLRAGSTVGQVHAPLVRPCSMFCVSAVGPDDTSRPGTGGARSGRGCSRSPPARARVCAPVRPKQVQRGLQNGDSDLTGVASSGQHKARSRVLHRRLSPGGPGPQRFERPAILGARAPSLADAGQCCMDGKICVVGFVHAGPSSRMLPELLSRAHFYRALYALPPLGWNSGLASQEGMPSAELAQAPTGSGLHGHGGRPDAGLQCRCIYAVP